MSGPIKVGDIQVIPQPVEEKALDTILAVAAMPHCPAKEALVMQLAITLQKLHAPPLMVKET